MCHFVELYCTTTSLLKKLYRSVRRRLNDQDWLISAVTTMSIVSIGLSVAFFIVNRRADNARSWTIENGLFLMRYDSKLSTLRVASPVSSVISPIPVNDLVKETWKALLFAKGENPTQERLGEVNTVEELNKQIKSASDSDELNKRLDFIFKESRRWHWWSDTVFYLTVFAQVVLLIFAARLSRVTYKENLAKNIN